MSVLYVCRPLPGLSGSDLHGVHRQPEFPLGGSGGQPVYLPGSSGWWIPGKQHLDCTQGDGSTLISKVELGKMLLEVPSFNKITYFDIIYTMKVSFYVRTVVLKILKFWFYSGSLFQGCQFEMRHLDSSRGWAVL